MSTVNPCYGCSGRVLGCHGTCEKYKAWKAEHDAAREKADEERIISEFLKINRKKHNIKYGRNKIPHER